MSIMIVDDSPTIQRLLQATLERAGYAAVHITASGEEALDFLKNTEPAELSRIDCILLDVVMPGMNGIQTCREIKQHNCFADTPIIMVTVKDDAETLRDAFEAGASDYITKPVRELELLTRVKAAILLKNEITTRKKREAELLAAQLELENANQLLSELTITDEITMVGNRRYFSGCLKKEWARCFRDSAPLSVIFIDIDCFQEFQDHYGQIKSDECLKLIAQVLQISLRRVGDHLARYSGCKFAVYLPQTAIHGADIVASCMLQSVQALQLKNNGRHEDAYVSVSLGAASVVPSVGAAVDNLLVMAEEALTQAKSRGGNMVVCYE